MHFKHIMYKNIICYTIYRNVVSKLIPAKCYRRNGLKG